jgi:hypothetical protein
LTEVELNKRERKTSEISNADSEIALSSDDHFNAFSNEDKSKVSEKSPEKEHEIVESEPQEKKEENTEAIAPEKREDANQLENPQSGNTDQSQTLTTNKSINDLINTEHIQDSTTQNNENNSKNRIELLDHLLSFVETDNELNYVLVGYFAKFLNLLLNKFPHKIIAYIYTERPEILDRLIQHCQKKSITEIIPKLILIESYLDNKNDKLSTNHVLQIMDKSTPSTNVFSNLSSPITLNLDTINNIRKNLLNNIFLSLSIKETDSEKVSNLSSICIEAIENRSILELILKDKIILDHLAKQLSEITPEGLLSACEYSDVNYNYCEVLNVFINIIRFSQVENLKCPTYKNEGTEDMVNSENEQVIENTLLGECVLENLDKILLNFLPEAGNKNDNNTVEGTFGYTYKPLGVKRVKLVELVYFLLNYFKNVQSILDKILIRSEFLKYLFQYFFQYEWNNTYQLNFESLIKHYLNHLTNHPDITKYLFEDFKILEVFIKHGNNCNSVSDTENGFAFNSNRRINHGYFAILIELCHKLSSIEVTGLKENYFTEEWHLFVNEKVHYWKKLFERKLCVPEAHSPTQVDEFSSHIEEVPTKEHSKNEEINEENSKNEESNPFPKKEGFFGSDNDDWFTPKNNEEHFNNDNELEDINNFEFVEDNRNFPRKSSKDEMFLKEAE